MFLRKSDEPLGKKKVTEKNTFYFMPGAVHEELGTKLKPLVSSFFSVGSYFLTLRWQVLQT